MSELIVPSLKPEFYGYTHSFDPYFEIDGKQIDRLLLIERYGVLSPRKAKKRNIPLRTNIPIIALGIDDYDDVIFLFPVRDPKRVPCGPGSLTLLISHQLPVLTPEEMMRRHNGNWIQMSHMWGGEVYTYGDIDPRFIAGVITR